VIRAVSLLFIGAIALVVSALAASEYFEYDLLTEIEVAHGKLFGDPLPKGITTVTATSSNIFAWDGQVVVIDGWLGKCRGYDCGIFPDPITEEKYKLVVAGDLSSNEFSKSLPIGSTPDFDEKAEALQFQRVLLTAKVNDECHKSECLDRVNTLEPIDIVKYTKGIK
jgi:hypothetical protein